MGLNFIDVYFRTGLYKRPRCRSRPAMRVQACGCLGAGVENVRVGERVAYAAHPFLCG
ncbi:hypothetical protein [Brucella neotomae]|uniref:hypothetical protein n=1 Tax=Brucella neotomae TaxID=29460 RepID=UPI003F6D9461